MVRLTVERPQSHFQQSLGEPRRGSFVIILYDSEMTSDDELHMKGPRLKHFANLEARFPRARDGTMLVLTRSI